MVVAISTVHRAGSATPFINLARRQHEAHDRDACRQRAAPRVRLSFGRGRARRCGVPLFRSYVATARPAPHRLSPFGYPGAGAVYALGLLIVHRTDAAPLQACHPRRWQASSIWRCSVRCLQSGGPFSQARVAFFALPLVATFRLRPGLTGVWSAVAVAAYVTVSLLHPALHAPDAPGQVLVSALYLAWAGAAAVALSGLLAAAAERITRLAAERQTLVRQALESESRARRRLAADLHDHLSYARSPPLAAWRRAQRPPQARPARWLRTAVAQRAPNLSSIPTADHSRLAARWGPRQRWSYRAGRVTCAWIAPTTIARYLLYSAAIELVSRRAHPRHAHRVEWTR